MVQVWGCDDSLSFTIFSVIFITFWSSQGNLSSKKSRKTEENTKKKIVSRFGKNVTRFDKTKTWLRHCEKRVTMVKT